MSRLRPTLTTTTQPASATGATAYLVVHEAVKTQPGLIHGQLDGPKGAHCAIGSYFHLHHGHVLPMAFIDEVAAVNDSVPTYTPKQRRAFVLRWLRWKLAQAGMPGFARKTWAAPPQK